MELQNSIGQCLRRFLGFRKNRIDIQNLRWRNLEDFVFPYFSCSSVLFFSKLVADSLKSKSNGLKFQLFPLKKIRWIGNTPFI